MIWNAGSETEIKIYKWKPIANRKLARLKYKWEDNVINYLKLMKVYE